MNSNLNKLKLTILIKIIYKYAPAMSRRWAVCRVSAAGRMKEYMKRSTAAKVCLVLAFTLVCSAALTGCRESEVLEQKIYTENKDPDRDNQTKMKNNDENNTDQDQQISSKKETDDADKERNQQDTQAVKGNQDNSSSTAKLTYGAAAEANGTAKGSGNGEQTGTDTQSVGVNSTTGITPGGNGSQQVVNDNGKTIEISGVHNRIAAADPAAASVVEMLGGTGILKASSQRFAQSSSVSLFADSGQIQQLWDGNGSSGMTDAAFQQLLTAVSSESSGKGAVLYRPGELSDAQIGALQAAEIDTYPINLTPDTSKASETYKEQIRAVGQMLGGDAEKKADQYINWYDDVIKTAESKAGDPVYSLFLQGWDAGAVWTAAGVTGTGLAIAPSQKHVRLLNEYLSTGGVINSDTKVSGELGQARYWYVNPLIGTGVSQVSLTGTLAEVLKEDGMNKLTSVIDAGEEGSITSYLGTSGFPAVITGSSYAAQQLNNDKNGGYLWKNWGQTSNGNASGYGFSYGSTIVSTTIHGDYKVFTLPSGVGGSWALGTPEGVLTSLWACDKFGGTVSDADIAARLKDLYTDIFGINVSDSQINSIMSGQ